MSSECCGSTKKATGSRFLNPKAKFAPSLVIDFSNRFFSGKFLYVDDLVARGSNRSRGFGGELLDWLIKQAREHDCENLELDSGVQRFDAHRFYFSKRMSISSYHFRIKIEQKD